jgi:ElaB/YqjD/DUF883 family membrane-anchored ribosome-binding protein
LEIAAMGDQEMTTDVTREKLIADFKVVLADAEEMLKATASQTGDKAAEMREKVGEHLKRAKFRLQEEQDKMIARTKEVAGATDDYVHDHPWQAVGVGAGVGLLIGLLIGRR